MAYKVLYRKYRPTKFSEIIGQDTITQNLKSSVINNTFAHAYIFTGPRGTGKTSMAKVLAKAINCLDNKNGEICEQCDSCKNFSTSPDIIEIDAASNNGVDEIRELRNNITLAPASSKFKIYIIDEVHMLSPGAFNALLKTLEEPPAHAIFILATTEIYKVPITIQSRCQRYDFKKINKDDLTNHIKNICTKEKIAYDNEAIDEIYALSEGCLRDALSILDQISKLDGGVTIGTLLKNYNILSNQSIEELLDNTVNCNTDKAIEQISSYENTGMNAQKLIKRIINYLEQQAIFAKTNKKSKYEFAFLNNLIKSLNDCYIDARINENVFTMIKLSFLEQVPSNVQVAIVPPSINSVTKQPNTTNAVNTEKKKKNDTLNNSEIRINNCLAEATKDSLQKLTDFWNNTKETLNAIKIQDYTPVASSEKYAIFTVEESSLVDLLNIKKEDIEKFLKKNKLSLKVVALTATDWIKEKEKYKNAIRSGKKYSIIEEKKETDISNNQANNLFTEKKVEVS